MTMRFLVGISLVALVAACTSPEPYEQPVAGVGFGSYSEYQTQREAALNGAQRGPGPVNAYNPQQTAAAPGFGVPITSSGAPSATGPGGLPASVVAAVDAVQPGAQPVAPLAQPAQVAVAGAVPEVPVNNTGISDEQDFGAVATRETIETDKARIEANRAQYTQILPGALPERSGDGASPIIEYAINAPNRLGQALYTRSGLSLGSHERACSRYATSAAAQEAFLKSGGPKRDPKNLDPDGDGFACAWDPTPFQKARG